jgi:hypothetical protein
MKSSSCEDILRTTGNEFRTFPSVIPYNPGSADLCVPPRPQIPVGRKLHWETPVEKKKKKNAVIRCVIAKDEDD